MVRKFSFLILSWVFLFNAQAKAKALAYFDIPTDTYEVSTVRNQFAQSLIDETFELLLAHTEFGSQLVKHLFHCHQDLIQKHLGVSTRTSRLLTTTICADDNPIPPHPWLMVLPDVKVEKNLVLRQKNQRTYSFVFIDETLERPLDSWTDFRTQTTTIYLPKNINIQQLRELLIYILAHETAIYFDQKSQLNTSLWFQHPEFSKIIVSDKNPSTVDDIDRFLTASNNPLISQVFSYIRAFRVETYWVNQLHPSLVIDLNEKLPLLSKICESDCLHDYVMLAAESISRFSLPLLANSRYWSMKLQEISALPPNDYTAKIRKVLISNRNDYVTQQKISPHGNFQSILNKKMETLIQETAELFQDKLTPEDMSQLTNSFLLYLPANQHSSLEFLANPSLGNFGVEMAAGPRPRIRTGTAYKMEIWGSSLIELWPLKPQRDFFSHSSQGNRELLHLNQQLLDFLPVDRHNSLDFLLFPKGKVDDTNP